MFAQTLPLTTPSRPFIILSIVDSSNNYAMAKLHEGLLISGTSLLALEQTSGKGQRGRKWISARAENITISIVYSLPHSFSADAVNKIQRFPFLLSACIALSCYDFIKAFGVHDIKIKWPNDLYIRDRKAGGILIENLFRGNQWLWTIAGIGINVNQLRFPGIEDRATSLAIASGLHYNIVEEARKLSDAVHSRLNWLEHAVPAEILHEFNSQLYKKNEEVKLRRENAVFATTIQHVDVEGKLHTSDVIDRVFAVGEAEFISE